MREFPSYSSQMLNWLNHMTHPDGDISLFNDAAFGIAPNFTSLEAYGRRLGIRPMTRRLGESGDQRIEERQYCDNLRRCAAGSGLPAWTRPRRHPIFRNFPVVIIGSSSTPVPRHMSRIPSAIMNVGQRHITPYALTALTNQRSGPAFESRAAPVRLTYTRTIAPWPKRHMMATIGSAQKLLPGGE